LEKNLFSVWAGQAFSLLGSELVQFSLIWYLTEKNGSASVLAVASFVALLPRVFLSPISGALVDRWNRQKVMIYADALIASATMILAGIFWLEYIQVWHIYVILFIRALGSGFHWPAMQASTSLLVPKDQLERISGMNPTRRGAMGIVAPLLAALMLEIFTIYAILCIGVITAIIAISPLLFVSIPQVNHTVEKMAGLSHIWDDIKAGFKFLVGGDCCI